MASENKWGESKGEWIKARSLVGTSFQLAGVKVGKGKMAGKYVFTLADGRLFSFDEDSATGNKIGSFGLPPPGLYTIEAVPNERSSTGDALILKPL